MLGPRRADGHVDGRTVTRQQFGSQKVKRSRSSGTPLDIGFDLKGAATDALKKCASLVGVGALPLEEGAARPASATAVSPRKRLQGRQRAANGSGAANGIHVVGATAARRGAISTRSTARSAASR